MEMPEVIRTRRAQLGLSQTELATAAGVDRRQIRRYEAGEQQPALNVAVAIARALQISVNELAGQESQRADLTGDWWASWQTSKEEHEVITSQEVRARALSDTTYELRTITRGIDVAEGGYMWRGELRLWDNEVLMGWYVANEGAVRSKGTVYYVLHPHGIQLRGRWVGMSYDGPIQTGFAAMAHSEDEARQLIQTLKTERTL
ncbi:MAG: helix-turn-helix transcriptional regulator [Solirubrobacteraceae bacterium]